MRTDKIISDKELINTKRVVNIVDKVQLKGKFKIIDKVISKRNVDLKFDRMEYSEEWIPRKDGSKLRLCIFKPLKTKENMPGVLWLHGGSFVVGRPEISKYTAQRLINASNCIVVAPAYRLPKEAPYPAALEDSYTALLWMKDNAESLGIRSDQLMVGGLNAGGNLTAATTLYARDKGEVNIAFQMPIYPMLDDRNNIKSMEYSNAIHEGWKLYLGKLWGAKTVPSYAAPARAKSFRNLPPLVTYVGELDIVREETTAYVEKIREAGIPGDFKVFKGCYHGFDALAPNAMVSKRAMSFLRKSFKYAVNNYFAEQSN